VLSVLPILKPKKRLEFLKAAHWIAKNLSKIQSLLLYLIRNRYSLFKAIIYLILHQTLLFYSYLQFKRIPDKNKAYITSHSLERGLPSFFLFLCYNLCYNFLEKVKKSKDDK